MDEQLHPDDGNVNSVLAQEFSELLRVLRRQPDSVVTRLGRTAAGDGAWLNAHAAPGRVEAMLEYFRQATAAECCSFLQTACLLCEDMPMRLESRLMSVAGCAGSDYLKNLPTETATLEDAAVLHVGTTSCERDEQPLTPPAEEQLTKRPRIDYWEQYRSEVACSLQRRWKRLSQGLVKDVQPDRIWVSIRSASRARDRADQTPGSAERGGRTPEPDGDNGWPESRLTLESFLRGCAGKVTVLAGQAGSGKTLLMSSLGQQWTEQLGPIPSSQLFILLEFRQLNLLSAPLSLSELLFRHYLPPNGDDEAKRAIVDYLLSNPEQSCWVLDGYDEFQKKLKRQKVHNEPLDPDEPVPVADLISGLLNRQLLPGSSVLVTCRVRDLVDLDGLSDKVGQLLSWDRHDIQEYVSSFFGVKDGNLGADAAEVLFSSRRLLDMSSLPALCNICCVYLQHLLRQRRDAEEKQTLEEKEAEAKKKQLEIEGKGVQVPEGVDSRADRPSPTPLRSKKGEADEKAIMDIKESSVRLTGTLAQIPPTQTQIYLAAVVAFLSLDPHRRGGNESSGFPQSTEFPWSAETLHPAELCELSRLAWAGLEEGKIVFLEEDVPQHTLELSVKAGLFSQVEFRGQDGLLVNAYCFVHLTVQEFLAALRIMTSSDVSDAHLKKSFSLKTRWTTKSDQKTAFTDSLYLYVCGLAAAGCTAALALVAKATGVKGAKAWVLKRQSLVLKLLEALCRSAALTGPKVLQLCHCVQESQDQQLARQVVRVRPTLELRNFWLSPGDIDALAFVVNAVGDGDGAGLDFGACSMELECLDALSRCRHVRYLSFRSRKYGDKFAEKLSSVLPRFPALEKLEFSGASVTAAGAASLASGLQNCPSITELNFSDNNLQDEGIGHIADILAKLQNLVSVKLGRNNTSLKAADCLVKQASSCLNIQHVHADGIKDLTLTFSQKSDLNSHRIKPEPAVRLLNQKWTKSDMQNLGKSLTCFPSLSLLDLSGGEWDEETLKTLTQLVPRLSVSDRIILDGSCSSVRGVGVISALLPRCPALLEMHIRLQDPAQASVVFSGGREEEETPAKTLRLSCCSLQPNDLERVWKSLGTSSGLSQLDLSCNKLGDKGLKKLLDFLHRLSEIRQVNFSNNGVSVDGVLMLADALCSCNRLTQIYISDGGKDQVVLQFSSDTSQPRTKVFSVNKSQLTPSDVNEVCRKLDQSGLRLELEFIQCSFVEGSIEHLTVLPGMSSLLKLNISHSIRSTSDALALIGCFSDSRRVSSVELSPQSESFFHFEAAEEDGVNFRLTDFSFKGANLVLLERLLEILQEARQLSHLDLSGNQLEDEGVSCLLASLPRLRVSSYINLSKNMLSPVGLLNVARTLIGCTDVSTVEVSLRDDERCVVWFRPKAGGEKTLSVRDSMLQPDHLLSLANILSSGLSLTKVELKNNLLRSEWIENFVAVLNSNQRGCTVSVEESWISGDEAARLLRRCLQRGNLIQSIRVDHTTLQLVLMKSVETSRDREVTLPAQFTAKSISFFSNTLGVEGAELLCSLLPSLPNLTSISVGIKDSAISVVEELLHVTLESTAVQRVSLSGVVISDAAAHTVTKLLPRLRSLSVAHCAWSAAGRLQLMEALKEGGALDGLCLDAATPLNEDCCGRLAQALRNSSALQVLKLNEIVLTSGQSEADVVLELLAGMEELTQIQEIELGGWRMADRGIRKLTGILPVWRNLRKISLSKNLLNDSSGEKLLEALRSCSRLEELHLSSNLLGDVSAASMALVLPSMTQLAVLDLSENRIGSEGLLSLSRAVMSLKSLRKIHLTSVGDPALRPVAASLRHCPFIQDVGFGWNNCGDDVAQELSVVLPFCHRLARIDLECNSVSAAGVEALVRALRSCPAPQLIRLWKNKMSLNEAQRFSQMERRLNFSST